jgi:hypothetical protein
VAAGTEKVREIGSTSPLLGAIADLREFTYRLFEEQKALLQSRDAEAMPGLVSAPAPRVVPGPPQPVAVSPEVENSSPVRTTSASAPAPVPVPARSVELSLPAEVVQPSQADAGPGGRAENPRQRLDALAKLLDKRLKPCAVPPDRAGDC